MKVVGLVVEYNPFHNGHLYHLEESKRQSGADCAVCVMSGNFIQRGEPAIINKWARARAALLSGVDLVIELPMVFAMSSAEYFAYGAVKILDSLGIVDYICFGSETGRIDELDKLAGILANESDTFKDILKEKLDSGASFPASREYALNSCLNSMSGSNPPLDIIGSSNNILGVEYLKALKKLGSSIVPLAIRRIANDYNNEELTGTISSTTSIRKSIQSTVPSRIEGLEGSVPQCSLDILAEEFNSGRGPVDSSRFENLILHEIRKLSAEELKNYPYITEGLENRIKKCAENSGTFNELVDKICTKRYTRTRIQRSLFCILNGITAEYFDEFVKSGGPQYIRVLGFNRKGRDLLTRIKEKASLPVISKAADYKNSENQLIRKMLALESQSTDIYVLGYPNAGFRTAGQEFTQNLIRI